MHGISNPILTWYSKGKREAPERYVVHVDMDAFFASVEQRDIPIYRDKPLIVCHSSGFECEHGVVSTCSYEARSSGVKSGMSVWEARKRCPKGIFIRADFERYTEASKAFIGVCNALSPFCEIFSVDEAFIDVTGKVAGAGWKRALEIAGDLKRAIKEKTGLPCSAGVGPNKLISKMASEIDKPDGLHMIKPEELPEAIRGMPVRSLVGVGAKMNRSLSEIGITTIGELADTPEVVLKRRYGVLGTYLHRAANGVEKSPVRGEWESDAPESFGNSLSIRGGTVSRSEMRRVLLGISDSVTERMRKSGFVGRSITLRACLNHALSFTRSKSLEEYTNLPMAVFETAEGLLDSILAGCLEDGLVSNLGISVSNLRNSNCGIQLTLGDVGDVREMAVMEAVDMLSERYGKGTVKRCSLL